MPKRMTQEVGGNPGLLSRKRQSCGASLHPLDSRRPHGAAAAGPHSPLSRIDPHPPVTTGVEAMVEAAQALMPKG